MITIFNRQKLIECYTEEIRMKATTLNIKLNIKVPLIPSVMLKSGLSPEDMAQKLY